MSGTRGRGASRNGLPTGGGYVYRGTGTDTLTPPGVMDAWKRQEREQAKRPGSPAADRQAHLRRELAGLRRQLAEMSARRDADVGRLRARLDEATSARDAAEREVAAEIARAGAIARRLATAGSHKLREASTAELPGPTARQPCCGAPAPYHCFRCPPRSRVIILGEGEGDAA